ncbi:hypothetical protein OQA88_10269 [Cercophora sp. LCS_1]
MPSIAQASLAFALLLSAIGTYLGTSPPHPVTDDTEVPPTGDFMRQVGVGSKLGATLGPLPPVILATHLALLASFYPNIPRWLLLFRQQQSQIDPRYLTWSRATAIPLVVLAFAVPLRLVSYSALGTNFTFTLAKPDRLVTTGIYAHVQHPSYTALVAIVVANSVMTYRMKSALGCWTPDWMSGGGNEKLTKLHKWVVLPVWVAFGFYTMGMRVMQEEEMMRGAFGDEWETWHAKTARFIPGVF